MNYNQYTSRLLEKAVSEFAQLPGIGRKTALRLVLHLLKKPAEEVDLFAQSITTLKNEIHHCRSCHNISDQELCSICSNENRDGSLICVVENIRDVMAIEATQQFSGRYHVLGGIISPMDGIGPADLTMDSLIDRVRKDDIREVILALSATMEGDTTNLFIYRKLGELDVNISTLARGVAIGDEIEYTDEITLGRSILHRTPFQGTLNT